MTLKLKRIIAREGLIILTVLLVGGFFLTLGIVFGSKYRKTSNKEIRIDFSERNGLEIENIYNFNINKVLVKNRGIHLFPLQHDTYLFISNDIINLFDSLEQNKNNKFPIKIKEKVIFDYKDLHFYESIFCFFADYSEKFGKFGVIILIMVYPLYLLVRFILWAIKTLRQKETTK